VTVDVLDVSEVHHDPSRADRDDLVLDLRLQRAGVGEVDLTEQAAARTPSSVSSSTRVTGVVIAGSQRHSPPRAC
jgi:hypothetical protein